ncbi:MAG: chemotaxis protein CheW [Gammaproteobacteria bacterium]|nr:chemotaxis protein CheW [Gammaproteobacteria bacterium]MDH5651421.1 chemotaxis protein CheW [Gammaproteobacteria bacterium]
MVNAVELGSIDYSDAENLDAQKYLTFLLPGKTYAVSIMKVKEIIEYDRVVDVPMMPDFICGAINLRGRVIPIIDLSVRLGGQASEIAKRTCIIVVDVALGTRVMKVGLVADAVSKVVDFRQDQIDEAPSFNGNINTDYIEGMGKTEDGFIIILNIDTLLNMEDMKQFAEINFEEGDAEAGFAEDTDAGEAE